MGMTGQRQSYLANTNAGIRIHLGDKSYGYANF